MQAGNVDPVRIAGSVDNKVSVTAFKRGAAREHCLCPGRPAKDQSQTGDSRAPPGARHIFHGCTHLRVVNGVSAQTDGPAPVNPQHVSAIVIGRYPRRGYRPDYSGSRFFAGRSGLGSTKPVLIAGGAPVVLLGSLRIYASLYTGKAGAALPILI
jgi:hypothetical protein